VREIVADLLALLQQGFQCGSIILEQSVSEVLQLLFQMI
jgi:hypothetical protein